MFWLAQDVWYVGGIFPARCSHVQGCVRYQNKKKYEVVQVDRGEEEEEDGGTSTLWKHVMFRTGHSPSISAAYSKLKPPPSNSTAHAPSLEKTQTIINVYHNN